MASVAKHLDEFGIVIQPVLHRMHALPPEKQADVVRCLLGACIGGFHDLYGGDEAGLVRACERTRRLLHDAVVRQESGEIPDA